MLSYAEAMAVVLRKVAPLPPRRVPLAEALGRVLAEPVRARWDLPSADNSAMDGYAFAFTGQREGDRLTLAGFLPAGSCFAEAVPAGCAVKIMTGAPLPRGCDTVVPVEEAVEAGGRITLGVAPRAGQHVRGRGGEIACGEPVLEAGTAIHAAETALLAASGVEAVRVHPAPRAAVLSTGDELVALGETPGPGQIVNSNEHLLTARLREEGCEVQVLGIARDNVDDLAERVGEGLTADLLISTGGVSVGDRDCTREVLDRFGFEEGFWRVRIKPGKPVLFGTVGDRPVFGLPGNPAASAATFELFVLPALRRLAGHRQVEPARMRVVLAGQVGGGEKRQRFLWGVLEEWEGRYRFRPADRQSSGQHRSSQGAQALLPVPADSEDLQAGEEVEVLLLRLPFRS